MHPAAARLVDAIASMAARIALRVLGRRAAAAADDPGAGREHLRGTISPKYSGPAE